MVTFPQNLLSHQNYLKSLLEYLFIGPYLRNSGLVGQVYGLIICIYNKLSGVSDASGLGITLRYCDLGKS